MFERRFGSEEMEILSFNLYPDREKERYDFEMDRRKGFLASQERVKNYFVSAGFTDEEVYWLKYLDFRQSSHLSPLFNQELANLLARLLPAGETRKDFFRQYDYIRSIEASLAPVREIQERIKVGENMDQFITDLAQTTALVSAAGKDTGMRNYNEHFILCFELAYEMMKCSELYQVFGNNPVRLGAFVSGIEDSYETISRVTEDIKVITRHENSEFRTRVLARLTEANFKPENSHIRSANLFRYSEYFPLTLKYLESSQSWGARLETLWDSFAVLGLPRVTDQEVDVFLLQQYALQRASQKLGVALSKGQSTPGRPLDVRLQTLAEEYFIALKGLPRDQRFLLLHSLRENTVGLRQTVANQLSHPSFEIQRRKWLQEKMARAKRRENPRHPLISLGIAKTIGFEVEHPPLEEIELNKRNIYSLVMSVLGLKCGWGGFNADEVSPGPFYDPETALAVLRMYSDAGFLDFYLHANMTCHFNLGIRDSDQFAFLIRNMYLSGAAYSQENSEPLNKDEHHSLRILKNNKGMGPYLEGKVFDALTQPALAWNLKTASYLSWAQSAAKDAETGKLNRYRHDLAHIWIHHESCIRRGAEKVGLGEIFCRTIPSSLYRKLDAQMEVVYPDLHSRYTDPATVSQRTIVKGGHKRVIEPTPVDLDKKHWPNIVAYTVAVCDETVTRIQEIEARVEADCQAAILEIETNPNQAQYRKLLDQFLVDFAVDIPDNATPDEKRQAYSEVKALFQDEF